MTDKIISLNVSITHGQDHQITVNITSTTTSDTDRQEGSNIEKNKKINERRIKDCLRYLPQSLWFYGHMSHSDAVGILDNTHVGTFLVRYSSNPDPKYPFSVSLKTRAHSVKSMRVALKDGLFYFRSETVFPNVIQLIQFYVAGRGNRTFADLLTYPRYHTLPSLAHLCRLRINRINWDSSSSGDVMPQLPRKIRDYIDLYPFFV